jgi:hypothetical protein
MSTRWDPDNCIALCYGCHQYLESRAGSEYREYMRELLGPERLSALVERSRIVKPWTPDQRRILVLMYELWAEKLTSR